MSQNTPAQSLSDHADAVPERTLGIAATLKKWHISDEPITWSNWYRHVNWLNCFFILFIPLCGFIAALKVPLRPLTLAWSITYYCATALGITAGYHRFWAHTSYKASVPLQIFLAFVGAGAVQGSIRWWARDHRAHHRWTDSERDPYSVKKGLLYSHLGWMVFKQDPKRKGRTDISDLNESAVVRWQHRHYILCVLVAAIVFPCGVASLWGDALGGLIYAGILRMFFLQQATFCVNSLAHYLGEQPFDDQRSPRDHLFTALVTMGEGYHNFHHEFPSDYRNALQWWQYDPTKWFIWSMKQIGLAWDLKEFRANVIEAGRVQQLQKKIDQRRTAVNWGVPLGSLEVVEWDTYVEECRKGRALVAVAGVIHDVSQFIADHPGGRALISSAIGKDATANFNGGVYDHSNAAHNLLATMRVGILRGGLEVEIWKTSGSKARSSPLTGNLMQDELLRAGSQITRVPYISTLE